MTREEILNLPGFQPIFLTAAAEYLRTNIPRKRTGSDATALINNEGRLNGYLDALDDLVALSKPQRKPELKADYQPYAAPQSESPNRP